MHEGDAPRSQVGRDEVTQAGMPSALSERWPLVVSAAATSVAAADTEAIAWSESSMPAGAAATCQNKSFRKGQM